MIAHVMRLTQWEWFKLRRRWMPWILLAVAVVLMQIGLWFGYAAYHNETLQGITSGNLTSYGIAQEVDGETISLEVTCASLANEGIPPEVQEFPEELRGQVLNALEEFEAESCGNTTSLDEIRRSFTIPGSIAESMTVLVSFAPVLVLILAASIVGTEYGWGTLRTTLTRGSGRWQLLASKIALALLACVAAVIVVAIAATVASLLASVIPPAETGQLADAGKWSEVAVNFGRAIYALAPYISLGVFLAVLTQSAAAGIAVSLGYYVIELIAIPILNSTGWGENIADLILGNNVNEWMRQTVIVVETPGGSSQANQPETLQAFMVILAYIVVLSAAAFWIFLRRDVAGAKGD